MFRLLVQAFGYLSGEIYGLAASGGTISFNLVGLTYSSIGPSIPGATIRTETNGSGLVASSTQLTFDFGLSGSNFGIQNPFTATAQIYCATSGFIQCGGNELFGAPGGTQGNDRWIATGVSGNVILGTVAASTATPEPGASVLVATGLAAFLLRKRNRVRS